MIFIKYLNYVCNNELLLCSVCWCLTGLSKAHLVMKFGTILFSQKMFQQCRYLENLDLSYCSVSMLIIPNKFQLQCNNCMCYN